MKSESIILLALGAYALYRWSSSSPMLPVPPVPIQQNDPIPATVTVTGPDGGIIWVYRPDITQIPFASSFQTSDPTFFDFSQ